MLGMNRDKCSCPVKIKIRCGRETKEGIAEVTKERDF